jgi:hypothetical protein
LICRRGKSEITIAFCALSEAKGMGINMKRDLNKAILELNSLIAAKRIDIEACDKELNYWQYECIVRTALLFYKSESQYQLNRYINKLNTAAKELEYIS